MLYLISYYHIILFVLRTHVPWIPALYAWNLHAVQHYLPPTGDCVLAVSTAAAPGPICVMADTEQRYSVSGESPEISIDVEVGGVLASTDSSI